MRFKSMAFQKLDHKPLPEADMIHRSQSFLADILKRRTVRDFSDKPVPIDIITDAVKLLHLRLQVPINNPGILW